MKTLRTLTRIATFTTFLLFTSALALAQDNAPDKVKIVVGFSNSEYSNLLNTEYEQGLYGEVDVKAVKRGAVRLGIVGRYDRSRFDSPSVDTYSAGARLSFDLAKGYISPFGHALFGATTSYNDDQVFTRTYGAGVDINLGRFFVRPIEVNWIRTEGLLSPSTQRFNAGAGFRF
jgi:hypothetical protein